MKKRPRVKHEKSFEERLADHATQLKQAAEKLPHGNVRERLLTRARQTETASHVEQWVTSAGLRPPK